MTLFRSYRAVVFVLGGGINESMSLRAHSLLRAPQNPLVTIRLVLTGNDQPPTFRQPYQ